MPVKCNGRPELCTSLAGNDESSGNRRRQLRQMSMTRREFVRRFLWPDWQQRKRMLWREAWVVVGAAYLLLAFAYLLPQDWRKESPGYLLLAWLAFVIRVLQFHVGLVLLIVVAAALRKRKRLLLAALPPAL